MTILDTAQIETAKPSLSPWLTLTLVRLKLNDLFKFLPVVGAGGGGD